MNLHLLDMDVALAERQAAAEQAARDARLVRSVRRAALGAAAPTPRRFGWLGRTPEKPRTGVPSTPAVGY